MSAKRSKILRALRPLIAVVLLALVATTVPWRDRLIYHAPGAQLAVAGEIIGAWRDPSIGFRGVPQADIEAGWPAELASDLRAGRTVTVTQASPAAQGAPAPGSFEWRPGMLRVFRELEPSGLLIALGMLLLAAMTSITRWWRLLHVAGCPASWFTTLRLTFLGFFFNLVVPGLTGGDLIKAVLVVRDNPNRRADALMSVIVDRGLGLLVLVGLAVVVVLISGDHFAELRWPVFLTFAGMCIGLWLSMHPGPRKVLRLEALLERLPQKERLKSLDRALAIYAQHPGEMLLATALSVFNHLSIAGGIYALGHAFQDRLSYVDYVGISSIANTVSSLPIAPGGWGVGEAAFGSLFHVLGAAPTLGVAVSVTYRLLLMALGLAGGIFLLLPGGNAVRRELETENAQAPGH